MSGGVQGWVDNDVHPPTFGLSVRVFHLYRALARHRPVRVTCAVKRRDRGPARERAEGVELRRVKPYHPALFHYLERLRLAPLFLAHDAYRLWPARLTASADPEAQVWQFDSLALCSLYDRAPGGVLRVYASQNVEAEWFERVGPRLVARRRWGRVLERIEGDAVRGADLVVAVSAEDRAGFLARYGAAPERVLVVENGFDPETVRPPRPGERERARADLGLAGETALLFLGSDFPHNRQAVEALFRDLVPRLSAARAVLFLAGSVAPRFAGRARGEGEGRVRCFPPRPDPRPFLWAADIGLNPVTSGAGSNVKLATYLGAGLPVLSTPFGVRGYERLVPFVTVAETERFAEGIARGLARPASPPAPLADYTWDRLGEKLSAAYDALLGVPGAARAQGSGTCAS
jgi:glycosyltransferase involved in cell wall biosynthesis